MRSARFDMCWYVLKYVLIRYLFTINLGIKSVDNPETGVGVWSEKGNCMTWEKPERGVSNPFPVSIKPPHLGRKRIVLLAPSISYCS